MNVPDCEPWCNSWVVVSKATGKPVLETWSQAVAEKVNGDAYTVLTAHQWLVSINSPNRVRPEDYPNVPRTER